MVSANTSAMKLDSQNANEWMEPVAKAAALILATPFSRLKIHVSEKDRDIQLRQIQTKKNI